MGVGWVNLGLELGEGGLSWGEEVQGSLFSVDSSFIEIRNGVSKLKKNFYRVDNPATDHWRGFWREILNKNRPKIASYPLLN